MLEGKSQFRNNVFFRPRAPQLHKSTVVCSHCLPSFAIIIAFIRTEKMEKFFYLIIGYSTLPIIHACTDRNTHEIENAEIMTILYCKQENIYISTFFRFIEIGGEKCMRGKRLGEYATG